VKKRTRTGLEGTGSWAQSRCALTLIESGEKGKGECNTTWEQRVWGGDRGEKSHIALLPTLCTGLVGKVTEKVTQNRKKSYSFKSQNKGGGESGEKKGEEIIIGII